MENFILVLKNRNFLFLWLCEAFSQIAMNMLNFILILAVFSLTSSNKSVSGIILSFTVPAIIFGLLAGVFVDRWNKKMVLFATNILRFILTLYLAFIFKNIILIYSISFISSIITQFFIPAETPMIPLLVEREQLLSANALFSVAWFGAVLVAYSLSGPFILLFGFKSSFLILSIIFLIASFFTFFIRNREIKNVKVGEFDLKNDIKKTFSIILKINEVYHAFLLLVLVQVLILIVSVLGPGYAKEILKININEFPIFFLTPAVIGMAFGSFIASNFFNNLSRHKVATLGIFIAGVSVILMPYVNDKYIFHFLFFFKNVYLLKIIFTVTVAFILGFANSLIFIPSNTLIQEHTNDEIRGKIYGALNSASSLLSIIPVIFAGWFADIFGVGMSLLVIGAIIFLIGIFRLAL